MREPIQEVPTHTSHSFHTFEVQTHQAVFKINFQGWWQKKAQVHGQCPYMFGLFETNLTQPIAILAVMKTTLRLEWVRHGVMRSTSVCRTDGWGLIQADCHLPNSTLPSQNLALNCLSMQTTTTIYHWQPKRGKEREYSFMEHPLSVMY